MNKKTLFSNAYFFASQNGGTRRRVSVCKGFAYHSVKVVFLAKGNRYEVDPLRFCTWYSHLSIQSTAMSQLPHFLTHIRIYSLFRSPYRSCWQV